MGVQLLPRSECLNQGDSTPFGNRRDVPRLQLGLLPEQSQAPVGGPRQAGGLPSGRAQKEQAALQLALRKEERRGGGGGGGVGPETAGLGS